MDVYLWRGQEEKLWNMNSREEDFFMHRIWNAHAKVLSGLTDIYSGKIITLTSFSTLACLIHPYSEPVWLTSKGTVGFKKKEAQKMVVFLFSLFHP